MKKLLFISCLLILSGCNYIATRGGYQKVESARAEIEKVKNESIAAIDRKEAEITKKLTEVISNQQVQMQKSANSLFAASLVRPFFPEETRPLILVFNRIDEAKSALGVGPTLEAMKVEQERLVVELDEKKTSLADLKKQHEKIIKDNEDLVEITKLSEEQVELLKEQKKKIEEIANKKIITKQAELSLLQDKFLDSETINKEQLAYIEKNKRLAMSVLGILSVAGLFIGLYLPLFKKQAFTFSAICGAGSIAIIFITPIYFAIVFTIAILFGLFFIFKKVGIVSQSAANSINTLHEFEEKHPKEYALLHPIKEEYNKKYAGISKVEDHAVLNYQREVLKDYERF
jgi:hypothetical protein